MVCIHRSTLLEHASNHICSFRSAGLVFASLCELRYLPQVNIIASKTIRRLEAGLPFEE